MTRTSAQINLYRAGAALGLGAALTCSGLVQNEIAEVLTPPGAEKIGAVEAIERFPEFLSIATEEWTTFTPIDEKTTLIPTLELGGFVLSGFFAGLSYKKSRELRPTRHRYY